MNRVRDGDMESTIEKRRREEIPKVTDLRM